MAPQTFTFLPPAQPLQLHPRAPQQWFHLLHTLFSPPWSPKCAWLPQWLPAVPSLSTALGCNGRRVREGESQQGLQGARRQWEHWEPERVPASHQLSPSPLHSHLLRSARGWPRSGSAGKSGHAVALRGSSWSGMWDIGHLLDGPDETSPLTQFLCSHSAHFSHSNLLLATGPKEAVARANWSLP